MISRERKETPEKQLMPEPGSQLRRDSVSIQPSLHTKCIPQDALPACQKTSEWTGTPWEPKCVCVKHLLKQDKLWGVKWTFLFNSSWQACMTMEHQLHYCHRGTHSSQNVCLSVATHPRPHFPSKRVGVPGLCEDSPSVSAAGHFHSSHNSKERVVCSGGGWQSRTCSFLNLQRDVVEIKRWANTGRREVTCHTLKSLLQWLEMQSPSSCTWNVSFSYSCLQEKNHLLMPWHLTSWSFKDA